MIWFNVKEAYDYLTIMNEVVTLREKSKRNGIHTLLSSIHGYPYGKGFVEVKQVIYKSFIPSESIDFLKTVVGNSGFRNVDEWITKLRDKDKPHYLLRVKLLKQCGYP